MAGKTNIAWATDVWNPSTGCTRVSSGCDRCYAFSLHDRRYAANLKAADEISIVEPRPTGSERIALVRQVEPTVLPFPAQYDLPFSKAQLLPDRLDAPLHWRKPRRVFVNSMSDLFHEDVPDGYLDAVFGVMGAASQHTFLVLTKRPERMLRYLTFTEGWRWDGGELHNAPLPNVLLGVSVEDQATADERIPLLLRTPAAKRFVSAEPLLSEVNLEDWLYRHGDVGEVPHHYDSQRKAFGDPSAPFCGLCGNRKQNPIHANVSDPAPAITFWDERIDWLIVGGETGKGHRPMHLDWPRSLRDQCQAAGVPYFYKQGSAPQPGKHRILDGRTWEEMPGGV